MKKATTTKKTTSTTSTKAPGTDRPTSSKATTTKTTTKAPSKSASASDVPKAAASKASTVPATPKAPVTPKTPKPPATPKTPKPPKPPATPKAPTTPKTPKPAASKPGPASSRPSTAKPSTTTTTTTTSKPAAAKRPATATTSKPATTKAPASRPATAKTATTETTTAKTTKTTKAAPPTGATKPTGTTTTTTTTTTTSKTTTKAPASRPATASASSSSSTPAVASSSVSPRETIPSGPSSARPSTSIPSLQKPTPPGPKSARPATSSGTTATKKATTPRGTEAKGKSPRDANGKSPRDVNGKSPRDANGKSPRDVKGKSPRDAPALSVPLKSPRSAAPQKSPRKSPRHNVAAVVRANTESEIQDRPHLTTGSRSVSVGGLQSNMTRAAPAGRRKPTVNPVKSRQGTPIRERDDAPKQRAAAGFLNGMGVLAAMGPGGEGQEFGQMQLRKVSEDKPKPLLIRVKGRRNVTARSVETCCKSLNRGDAFVLIDPASRTVYEWRGAAANKMEIAKAMDIAGRVKNKEFGGRADVFVLEDGKTDQNPKFWELMGGKGNIAPADNAGEDEDEDKIVRQDYLFGIVEKTPGKPELQEIARHKFSKEMLVSGQVYLLDCLTELYMWVGKGCANSHRTLIAAKAQEALTVVKGRPKWVTIGRVIEGAEPEIFKEKFCDWPSTLPITMAAIPKGNVAAKAAVKFDVATMFVSPKRDDRNIDDGSGKVEIWRVKDHAKEAIDKGMYGQFFDSESYVILYKYIVKNREMFVIYFWQGKHSSINEKGSSALLTIDLDDSIGGNATQIRVVQNKEPKHFMKLFGGYMIVHKASETEDGASAVPETALYQIRGCNQVESGCDTRAVQLATLNSKYLNTNDRFLLNTPEKQFIWMGANSSKIIFVPDATLVQLGNTIKGSREQVFIQEGEEPAEFWEHIGQEEYYKTAWKRVPRLFHCSSASGSFKVEEVIEWDQEDLDPGHLNILDTSLDIFLWTGQRAHNIEDEKKQAMETVLEYSKLHPVRKAAGVVDEVYCVIALKEPIEFRSVFLCWDEAKSKSVGGVVRVEDLLKDLSRNYTLVELRNPPRMLDSTKLETYLSTEEFASVFKMDKEAFAAQPLWKREQQKKSVGLY